MAHKGAVIECVYTWQDKLLFTGATDGIVAVWTPDLKLQYRITTVTDPLVNPDVKAADQSQAGVFPALKC